MGDAGIHRDTIFNAARHLADPEARRAYLEQACAGAPELHAKIEALLKAYDEAGGFLEGGIAAAGLHPELTLDPPILLLPPGTLIGRYKLLEPIGEGGYGVVFMAEQTEPVQRKVALKIIKAGMDTRQVIARFEAERQALALMDHPNIAKVFDAGMTDAGRPYFVMELVKGIPITKYCDEHHIEPRQRLELFMQVCQAVQHAHQKGIIHRDLKPSNVLVAQYDGKPVPKVIDFGVAKATGQSLTDLTMFTGFGDVIGTLEYMSPEQADVNQLDVDTRSDIYSLGVLLYELLTGTTPLEHKRVMKAGLLEMLRVVREEEPQRPSTRLNTSEQLPSISANRGLEPRKLSGLVKGELDWIVLKALEKDRSRRYETANGLAIDVQRYLDDEAVQACPPSARYRLRKFVRRHKVALFTTTAMAAALLLGTLISTWQAVRATKAERLAETRLNAEAQARKRAQANLDKAREAVAQITEIADEKLSNVPHMEGVRRELLESALQFYLGFLQQESIDRDIRRETAIAYGRAAEIHRYLGNKSKALEFMRESIARLEKLAAERESKPAERAALVNYYNALPFYYGIAPQDEAARMRRSIDLAKQLVSEFPDEPSYKRGLARSYGILGRSLVPTHLEEAERSMRQGLRLAEEMGDQIPIAAACVDLGYLLMNKADPVAAQWFRRGIAIFEKQASQSSLHRIHREMIARSLYELGQSLLSVRKHQEAAEAFRRSVDIWVGLMTDYPSVPESRKQCAFSYVQLGISLSAVGQDTQADLAFQKALEVVPQDASLHNNLAWQLATGADAKPRDFDRAVRVAKRAIELAPQDGNSWNTLGTAQYRAGDWRGAIESLNKAVELHSGYTSFDAIFLAMAHWKLGEQDEARRWYGLALARMEKDKAKWDRNPESKARFLRFRTEAEEVLKITDREPTTKPAVEVK